MLDPARTEQRQLTLIFADLVGSTAFSEKLDLEQYHALLVQFLDGSASIIRQHNGFIAQYQGDCILGYFGFPQATEDYAEQATAAGLAIIEMVAKIRTESYMAPEARIGIATGVVLVGNLLKDGAAAPNLVMGEAPNLASRLQTEAEPGAVLVCDNTRKLLGKTFLCDDLGTKRLKGFSESTRAWKVTRRRRLPSRFKLNQRGALTPYISREEEIALLMDRWSLAKGGKGQTVLIEGEVGIGKSRLARVVIDRTAQERRSRLDFQCVQDCTGSAFHPLVSQMEFSAGFGAKDTPGQKLDKLERLVAAQSGREVATLRIFARLFSIPADDRYGTLDLTPAEFKDAVFDAILAQLEALSRRATLLMVLEDLHWIDPTTAEFLNVLIDRIASMRALFICTNRSKYLAPWTSQAHVTRLSLRRFEARQAANLVGRVAGQRTLPDQVINAIVAQTDGIPLFLEEQTKSILESDEMHSVGAIHSPVKLALPSTLLGSLQARLDRVADVNRVASIGAAIGRTFDHDLLSAVSGLGENELRSVIQRLIDSGLICHESEVTTWRYSFTHALIQEAAYVTLLPSQRQALHARIAETLEGQFPDIAGNRPEIVARHFAAAQMPEQALIFWQRAAEIAARTSANIEAATHLRSALRQNESIEDAKTKQANETKLRELLLVHLEASN